MVFPSCWTWMTVWHWSLSCNAHLAHSALPVMVTSLLEVSTASSREVETASKRPAATARNNMDFFIGYVGFCFRSLGIGQFSSNFIQTHFCPAGTHPAARQIIRR